jgi:hypothetical protein
MLQRAIGQHYCLVQYTDMEVEMNGVNPPVDENYSIWFLHSSLQSLLENKPISETSLPDLMSRKIQFRLSSPQPKFTDLRHLKKNGMTSFPAKHQRFMKLLKLQTDEEIPLPQHPEPPDPPHNPTDPEEPEDR